MDNVAIVTPAQSKEYEERALEQLWDGSVTASEWASWAEIPSSPSILRCGSMMVQDIQNPEYIMLGCSSNDDGRDVWSERTPVYLLPYPSAATTSNTTLVHRDKRVKTNTTTTRPKELLAYFYHDTYPCPAAQERLRINELVNVVAIPASANSESSSMDEEDTNEADQRSDTGWHILWYQRCSLYDGTSSSLVRPQLLLSQCSLAQQALALLLFSRTERTVDGKPVLNTNSCYTNDEASLLGSANLQWIVDNDDQRDALLRALPEPYTIVSSSSITTNDNDMIPRKLPCGRLRQSPLQLPAGALLVLDLTCEAATVNDVIKQLLETRRLTYSFDGGLRLMFEADYRILVITKSNVMNNLSPENTFIVHLNPEFDANHAFTGLPELSERVELPSTLLESVVEAYASCTEGQKSEALLHRWLVATRSMARFHGRSTATLEDWDTAYQLERKLRETTA